MSATLRFAGQRQRTLDALRQATAAQSQTCCAPLNGFGMFGWVFEGQPDASDTVQGDLRHGLAYLGHMIDQGFKTAFAVVQGSQPPLVCLKICENA